MEDVHYIGSGNVFYGFHWLLLLVFLNLILFIPVLWRGSVNGKLKRKSEAIEKSKFWDLFKSVLVRSFFGIVYVWFFIYVFHCLADTVTIYRTPFDKSFRSGPIDHLGIYVYTTAFFSALIFLTTARWSLLKFWLFSLTMAFLSFLIPVIFLIFRFFWIGSGNFSFDIVFYVFLSVVNLVFCAFFLCLLLFTWLYLKRSKFKK